MPGEMGVHLFQLRTAEGTPRLEPFLREMEQHELTSRLRDIGGQEVRLESIVAPHTEDNDTPYWLLDFTKLRFEHGPGRASRIAPIAGFELEEDEGFGEETAALFDARHRAMLIQYNHHGVRSATIEHYFNLYVPDAPRGYELILRMDDAAEVKFARKQILTKLHFKISPPRMSPAQRHAGVRLARALEMNDDLRGANIEVVISAGRSHNAMLNIQHVHRIIEPLRRLIAEDAHRDHDHIVQKLEIEGKDDALAQAEAISLLTPKLEQRIAGLELGGDLRYTRRSRWDALLRARNGWRAQIEQ
ncbi:MAG: DUF6731 family protein [Burkholderia gladioli]